jgi:hypothetical protein
MSKPEHTPDPNRIAVHEFSNPESKRRYEQKFPGEPGLFKQYEDGGQCGGCAFFAPLNTDFGICCSSKSRHRLETVFEHFSCPELVWNGWGAHSFSEEAETARRIAGGKTVNEDVPFGCIADLEIRNVLVYNDGPLLYSAQNKAGELFLVHWVDREHKDSWMAVSDTWVVAPQDEQGIKKLQTGMTTVREACLGNRGVVYIAREMPGGGEEIKAVNITDLSEDVQVEPDVRLVEPTI